MKFDPDKPHNKVRGLDVAVHYIQDGHKFDAARNHVGKIKGENVEVAAEVKKDVRARAAAKMQQKKGSLEGFKAKENPDALDSMLKENNAAKEAEDLAE